VQLILDIDDPHGPLRNIYDPYVLRIYSRTARRQEASPTLPSSLSRGYADHSTTPYGRSIADAEQAMRRHMTLDQEKTRLEELLGGKTVAKIIRHRANEIGIVFTDGTRLFVDSPAELELSVT